MNCRHFRQHHVAFVDRMMNEWQLGEMYGHLERCAHCERLDTVVRRGLLVARNLPLIEPSRDFMPRLEARLRTRDAAPRSLEPIGPSLRLGMAAVALAMIGAVAITFAPRTHVSPSSNVTPTAGVVPPREYPASGSWGFAPSAPPAFTGWTPIAAPSRGRSVPGPVVFRTASLSR